jgi:5-methylcytosine-specific restriction endonuclease McrA
MRDWSKSAPKYPTWIAHTCPVCGTQFKMRGHDWAKKVRLGKTVAYCSHPCAQVVNRVDRKCETCGESTGRKTRRFCDTCRQGRRLLPTEECPICFTLFRPASSRQTYCSRPCASQAHSIRMTGAGNSYFKDGTSYTKKFREIRPAVRQRDGGSCVACGNTASLVIHHVDEDVANNEMENLVTLCRPCHAVHHKSHMTPFSWLPLYAEMSTKYSMLR